MIFVWRHGHEHFGAPFGCFARFRGLYDVIMDFCLLRSSLLWDASSLVSFATHCFILHGMLSLRSAPCTTLILYRSGFFVGLRLFGCEARLRSFPWGLPQWEEQDEQEERGAGKGADGHAAGGGAHGLGGDAGHGGG